MYQILIQLCTDGESLRLCLKSPVPTTGTYDKRLSLVDICHASCWARIGKCDIIPKYHQA
jgi:hypothetical protein